MEVTALLGLILVLTCAPMTANTCSPNDPLDLIFVVDYSIHIEDDVYQQFLDFIALVINGLNIDESATKIAILSSDSDPHLKLNLTSNRDIISQNLHSIPVSEQGDNIYRTMDYTIEMISRDGRPDARSIVVVVKQTNKPEGYDVILRNSFKIFGTDIIAVGVGPVDELNMIKYPTKPEYLVMVDDINSLNGSADRVRDLFCEVMRCSRDSMVDLIFAIATTEENYPIGRNLSVAIKDKLNIGFNDTFVGLTNFEQYYPWSPKWIREMVDFSLRAVPKRWNGQSPLKTATELSGHSGRRFGKKFIVFMTDGPSFNPEENQAYAELAKSKGYIVFTYALTSNVDQNLLSAMASDSTYSLPVENLTFIPAFAASHTVRGTCQDNK